MREDVSADVAQKTLELVQYLDDPGASVHALDRMKYFKEHPLEQWATYFDSDEDDRLLWRGRIHMAISMKENELKLAKRLNLIALWSAVIESGGTDETALRDAKVYLLMDILISATDEKHFGCSQSNCEDVGT